MKICILTGKFGMGHFNAAQAIKQQLEKSIPKTDIEIIDWMSYISPVLADKYYVFFTLLVNKGCRFYNKRYLYFEDRKTNQKPEFSHYFTWLFSRLIKTKKPDLIISTLPICSQIVSLYKEKTASRIPLITCVTDITGHSEWISRNTELYMVGSLSVKEKFMKKGVPPDKIHVTGIPVRLEFHKDSVMENGTHENSIKKILVMGGGLGILPEDDHFYNGLVQLPNVEITIITGKNQKLFEQISRKYNNLKVLGYVNNVYDYMKQADVIITKPGGITTFEAIHAEVPILALSPLLQQEVYNAQFIQEMRIGAVISADSEFCLEDITRILEDDNLYYYKSQIQTIKKHIGEGNIANILNNLIAKESYLKYCNFNYENYNESGDCGLHEKITFNI